MIFHLHGLIIFLYQVLVYLFPLSLDVPFEHGKITSADGSYSFCYVDDSDIHCDSSISLFSFYSCIVSSNFLSRIVVR